MDRSGRLALTMEQDAPYIPQVFKNGKVLLTKYDYDETIGTLPFAPELP